jgi:glycerol kinase
MPNLEQSAPVVLAIDQGTSGSTVLCIDRAGQIVGRGYREVPGDYPRPGWVEQDAQILWERTLEAVAQALAAIPGRPLAALGIANQRETTVLWEAATGAPVAPAIVWQDRRTAPLCDQLRAEGWEPEIRRRTGLVIDPYFSGTKLRWLLDQNPGWRRRATAGELRFGTIDSWLVWRLTGGTLHWTDYTNASRTLLFNLAERRWDPFLLDRLGIPPAVLPSVGPSSGEIATTTATPLPGGGRLPAGIPIAGVAGDQQAALFGQTGFEPGTVKCTYGTGAFLLMQLGDRLVHAGSGLLTTLACGPRGEPTYALEGSVFVAGAAVQWLRDQLGVIRDAAETEALAHGLADNGGVYLVPAFAGLGAPYWDPAARGAIVGLTRGTGRAHLARAALEAIAYQIRDVVDAMVAEAGMAGPDLRIDGGAAANNFLAQFQADLLNRTVVRPRIIETTALGAAYLAGLAIGQWTSPAELTARWEIDRRFLPGMPAERREALYRGWRHAVTQVRLPAKTGT